MKHIVLLFQLASILQMQCLCFPCYFFNSTKQVESSYGAILKAQNLNLTLHLIGQPDLNSIYQNLSSRSNCSRPLLTDPSYRYNYHDHCNLRISPIAHKTFKPTLVASRKYRSRPKLAIGVPVSSRRVPFYQDSPLINILIPSLRFNSHHLIIAYDDGDYFYDNPYFRDKIIEKIPVSFEMYRFPRVKSVNFLWNWMFFHSWESGFEYFLQSNDDARYSSDFFELTLGENAPLPTVVFPKDERFGCTLITQALIYIEAHAKIFDGFLYPPELINWQGDRWLTRTYPEALCHGTVVNKRPWDSKPRYQPCRNTNQTSIHAKYKRVQSPKQ